MARKKQLKAKEPVAMRFKKLANGNQSIYLDYYSEGKREYEFLKLYIIPEVNQTSKMQNANTLQVANAIKAQRIIEISNGKGGICSNHHLSKVTLIDWLIAFRDNREKDGKNFGSSITNTINILKGYRKGNVILKDVDKAFCTDFISHMRHTYKMHNGKSLSDTTIANNARALGCAFNKAVRDGIIPVNPLKLLSACERPQTPTSKREYLSIEEVKLLIQTPCERNNVKQAFLFACFCGLRHSDVANIVWKDINVSNGQTFCNIVMQKTGEPLYLPLSDEALKWLPSNENSSLTDKIFNLPSDTCSNRVLRKWVKDAGINKHVTFHVSRHTFATMMITKGADLYTVSKLLGHSDIKVTEVYAKMVNQKKVDAVNLLNGLFNTK